MRGRDPLLEAALIALGLAAGFVGLSGARETRVRRDIFETLAEQEQLLERQRELLGRLGHKLADRALAMEQLMAADGLIAIDSCPTPMCSARYAREVVDVDGPELLECMPGGHRWDPAER